MKHNRRRSPGKPRVSRTLLDHINPHVAGIDCGSAEHVVAVPPDRDPHPVQAFSTFTTDLLRLADWLTACRVTSVAMEATGVYWIPIYEILEARGFEVIRWMKVLAVTPKTRGWGQVKGGTTPSTKSYDVTNVGDDPMANWTSTKTITSGTLNQSATSGTAPKTVSLSVKTARRRGIRARPSPSPRQAR